MTLKLYGDHVSQPLRAVAIFMGANNIEYELVPVNFAAGGHKSPAYLAINPRGQVPVLVDDGFNIAESATMLRYLSQTRSVPDHWYPADIKERTRVDQLLDWYHTNLRQTARYVFAKELLVNVFKGAPPNEAETNLYEMNMLNSIKLLEESYLSEEGPFLLGASQPSIADVLLSCEFGQLECLAEPDRERVLGSKPKTKKWLEALEKNLAPHFADAHERVRSIAKDLEAARRVSN